MAGIEDKYQIESAMDTLLRAEDIKQNKNLLSKAINIMKKKQKNMSAILREAAIKAALKK
jgi:hypothetical protein